MNRPPAASEILTEFEHQLTMFAAREQHNHIQHVSLAEIRYQALQALTAAIGRAVPGDKTPRKMSSVQNQRLENICIEQWNAGKQETFEAILRALGLLEKIKREK